MALSWMQGRNARGIVLMCLAMAFFTLNDAAMKFAMEDVPMMQAIFMRGALVTVGLVAMAAPMGGLWVQLPPRDGWLVGARVLAELLANVSFLAALVHMPLADMTSILQSLPLLLTLVAALFFGEKVGWRRFVAIGVGFLGVLLIIRPGTGGFSLWSLVALVSVMAVVFRDIATRQLNANVPTIFVALMTSIGVTAFGGIGTLWAGEWVSSDPEALWAVALAGFCMILASMASVGAMRSGDMGVVQPFRYTALIWALLLGYLLFGTLPDVWGVIGALLIVGSGVFTLLRERRIRRQAKA